MNSSGIDLAKKGKREEANQVYLETISATKNPDYNSKLHYNIALNLFKMDRSEQACQHLQAAIDLNPDFIKAQRLLEEQKKKEIQAA